jgi:hypothetical protein
MEAGSKKRVQARTLHRDKNNTNGDICKTLHISRTTLGSAFISSIPACCMQRHSTDCWRNL